MVDFDVEVNDPLLKRELDFFIIQVEELFSQEGRVTLTDNQSGTNLNAIALQKPISFNDLLVEIKKYFLKDNLLREESFMIEGLIKVNRYTKTLHYKDIEIGLRDKEVEILDLLNEAEGGEVDKYILLSKIWGYQPDIETHTLETHIYRLRQKLVEHLGTELIITCDIGYVLSLKELDT